MGEGSMGKKRKQGKKGAGRTCACPLSDRAMKTHSLGLNECQGQVIRILEIAKAPAKANNSFTVSKVLRH